jgi:hypothetical protein
MENFYKKMLESAAFHHYSMKNTQQTGRQSPKFCKICI